MRTIQISQPIQEVELPANRILNQILLDSVYGGKPVLVKVEGSDAVWRRVLELTAQFFPKGSHRYYHVNEEAPEIEAIAFDRPISWQLVVQFHYMGWLPNE